MSLSSLIAIRNAESFALQRMLAYAERIGETTIASAIVSELTRRGLAVDVYA